MRVQSPVSNSVQSAQQTESSKKSEAAKKSGENKSKASVLDSASVKSEISAKSRDYKEAHAVAAQAPDVRETKIEEIKKRIAEGRYKVDADKVADKLVNDHLSF